MANQANDKKAKYSEVLAELAQQVADSQQPQLILAEPRMKYTNVQLAELFYLVGSCSFLDDADRRDVLEVYKLLQQQAELDNAFSVIIEEEKQYLEEEIKSLAEDKLEGPNKIEAELIIMSYRRRLEQLNKTQASANILDTYPALNF